MNELDILARKYGTDKRTNDEGQVIYHGYTDIYYTIVQSKKLEYKNILEIGVREGWSHLMWRDFFPKATIYGIDDFSDPLCVPIKGDRLKILKADQTDEEKILAFLDGVEFDMIIDDGSHMSWHQQKTFDFLFSKLKPNGYYIIEDLGVCYNRAFREYDAMESSTLGWLHSIMKDSPFSYYITPQKMKSIYKQIKFTSVEGELGIIVKNE